jgi:hypothetical protein
MENQLINGGVITTTITITIITITITIVVLPVLQDLRDQPESVA